MAKSRIAARETMTLAEASRRLGITLPTAAKLADDPAADFLPVFWIGQRRFVLERDFYEWITRKATAGRSARRLASPISSTEPAI